MPGFEKLLLVGVCRVTMSIMPVCIMAMRLMTVAMIIMTIVAVAAMSVVIISQLFWKLTETSKSTGQLSRPAQQSDTGQHRHVNELTNVIADRQTKHHMFRIDRRGH